MKDYSIARMEETNVVEELFHADLTSTNFTKFFGEVKLRKCIAYNLTNDKIGVYWREENEI